MIQRTTQKKRVFKAIDFLATTNLKDQKRPLDILIHMLDPSTNEDAGF
jgi:hypothetical protein